MIDIVVSHYNEDLSWLEKIKVQSKIKVYSKTLESSNNQYYETIKQNRNIGNEASSYLNYIIDNYYNLPDYVYFCHGHNNSYHQNYSNIEIINNIDYSSLPDFLNINNFYNKINNKRTETLLRYENITDNKPYLIISHFFRTTFISKFFSLEEEYNSFSCAQFFTKRELILSNSLDFYKHCLEWFNSGKSLELDRHFSASENVYSSRIFEWMWYYIFTKKTNEEIIQISEHLKK